MLLTLYFQYDENGETAGTEMENIETKNIGRLTSISGKGILILESIISQLYALRKST